MELLGPWPSFKRGKIVLGVDGALANPRELVYGRHWAMVTAQRVIRTILGSRSSIEIRFVGSWWLNAEWSRVVNAWGPVDRRGLILAKIRRWIATWLRVANVLELADRRDLRLMTNQRAMAVQMVMIVLRRLTVLRVDIVWMVITVLRRLTVPRLNTAPRVMTV